MTKDSSMPVRRSLQNFVCMAQHLCVLPGHRNGRTIPRIFPRSCCRPRLPSSARDCHLARMMKQIGLRRRRWRLESVSCTVTLYTDL
jgi:hypothetical protein